MKRYNITDKQKRAVKLFYQGLTLKEVCAELGVHRTTLWRWYCKEDVQRYGQWYFAMQNAQLTRKMDKELEAELNSPNPFKAYHAASRVLSKLDEFLKG